MARNLFTPKVAYPEKLSEAIYMAIRDLHLVEQDISNYRVSMSDWHSYWGAENNMTEKCNVCFAGSVMAKTCETDRTTWTSPDDFPYRWRITFEALNQVRTGNIAEALVTFYDEQPYIFEAYGDSYELDEDYDEGSPSLDFPPPAKYEDNKKLFKEQMLDIAAMLEVDGY